MRRLNRTAAVLAALLATTGLANAQVQQIEWWDFLAGGDGVRMKALIEDFNAEHPNIQINGTTSEWGVPFYTKVRTSASVGQGPDIMTYHLSRIPLAMQEGVLDEITDEDLQRVGLSRGDFFEAAVDAATHEGALYGVPFDVHAIVLYYNKDALEGTDFLDDNGELIGIDSLEDFERVLEQVAEKGVDTPLSFQTGGAGGTYRVFYTLFRQQGGELITNGEVLAGDNLEKAANAIEVMTRWRENGWIPEQADYQASVALFSSGRAAFKINGVWEVPTLKDLEEQGNLGFEWAAVEVPTFMEQRATWADSHAFAIPLQAGQRLEGEKREAVMTVIGWMQENAIRWAEAGHIPAYVPAATSDEYRTMEPNATYASLADYAVYDPRSEIAGVASPVYDAALNIISPAMHGYLSPEEAAQQMQQELQSLLR